MKAPRLPQVKAPVLHDLVGTASGRSSDWNLVETKDHNAKASKPRQTPNTWVLVKEFLSKLPQ